MDALLIVDVQNDFMSQGALPVPQAEKIIPVINALIKKFACIVASKDWHPSNHISFASAPLSKLKQHSWPNHCIQNSYGAEFFSQLDQKSIGFVVYKGTLEKEDSYSAFFNGEQNQSTGLHEFLQENDVSKIFITGLALEYCVAATAIDAQKLGYKVFLIEEGIGSLNMQKEARQAEFRRLNKFGIEIISCKEIL